MRVAKSLGLTLSLWTNTFADTAPMCKNRTIVAYNKATAGTEAKVVVLGHVNPYTAQTVKLLAAVIANYDSRGYQFVTIPEMVKGTPNTIDWAKAALAVSAPAISPTGCACANERANADRPHQHEVHVCPSKRHYLPLSATSAVVQLAE